MGIIYFISPKMPSLVFDMMEPFRPLVDRLLLDAVLNNEIKVTIETNTTENTSTESNTAENDTTESNITGNTPAENANTLLTKPARKNLINLFNNHLQSRIKYRGNVTLFKNHILTEANRHCSYVSVTYW